MIAPSVKSSKSHMLHGTGIFTYMNVKSMVNLDKYTNPMEHLGIMNTNSLISGVCFLGLALNT